MKPCFYCSDGKESPIEKYFYDKYGTDLDLPDLDFVIDEIANIFAKWKYVAENNGGSDGHYAKKMHGYDFIEIRVKRSNTLIRFPYYRDCNNSRLVLLLGFDKKDGYKSKDKTDKYVKKKMDEAQLYYNQLYKNLPNYA